jgi:pentatricopeptide repeat protein
MSHNIYDFSNLFLGSFNNFINKLYGHGVLLLIFIISYWIFKRMLNSGTSDQKPKDAATCEKESIKKFSHNPYSLSVYKDTEKPDNKGIKSVVGCSLKNKEIDTYGTLEDFESGIRYYSEKLNEEKCIEILDKMNGMMVIPTYDIYYAIMTLFLKNKKVNQALGMFNDMKVNGVEINENTYYVIIKGCLDCDKVEQGSEILLDCVRNRIELNRDIYNQVALRLVNNAMMKQNEKVYYVSELLVEFKRLSIKINNSTFFTMLKIVKKVK